jgi:hypothetical protein
MKRCSTCKVSHPLDFFYRDKSAHDGLSSRCKSCSKAHAAHYGRLKRAQIIRYDRSTNDKYCSMCNVLLPANSFGTDTARPDGLNPACKQCRNKTVNKKNQLERTQKHRKQYPDRMKARSAISKAIQRKRIPRVQDMLCILCQNPAHHYHHHLGYHFTYRYHVVPVCTSCHMLVDRGSVVLHFPDLPPVFVPYTK